MKLKDLLAMYSRNVDIVRVYTTGGNLLFQCDASEDFIQDMKIIKFEITEKNGKRTLHVM